MLFEPIKLKQILEWQIIWSFIIFIAPFEGYANILKCWSSLLIIPSRSFRYHWKHIHISLPQLRRHYEIISCFEALTDSLRENQVKANPELKGIQITLMIMMSKIQIKHTHIYSANISKSTLKSSATEKIRLTLEITQQQEGTKIFVSLNGNCQLNINLHSPHELWSIRNNHLINFIINTHQWDGISVQWSKSSN